MTITEVLMLSPQSPSIWMKDYPATWRLTCLPGGSAEQKLAFFIFPPRKTASSCSLETLLSFPINCTTLSDLFCISRTPLCKKTLGLCLALPGAAHLTQVASFPLLTPVCFPLLTTRNVCFLCAMADLQTATLDNISSWIMLRNINERQWFSFPFKYPCLQTPYMVNVRIINSVCVDVL